MENILPKEIVINMIKTQCTHTHRPNFKLRRIFNQYVLFGWYPWKSFAKRLIFSGNWRPVAFLTFDSTSIPYMSFCCSLKHSSFNFVSEYEAQNKLFSELKVDNLIIKDMSIDQESLFHRQYFFIKS